MAIQPVGSPLLSGSLVPYAQQSKQPVSPGPAPVEAPNAERPPPAREIDTGQAGFEAGKASSQQGYKIELERALDDIRKVVEPVARNLRFSIDEATGRTVISVIDTATDEVIRQIPSEEILSIAKALDKLKGLLIKQEA